MHEVSLNYKMNEFKNFLIANRDDTIQVHIILGLHITGVRIIHHHTLRSIKNRIWGCFTRTPRSYVNHEESLISSWCIMVKSLINKLLMNNFHDL